MPPSTKVTAFKRTVRGKVIVVFVLEVGRTKIEFTTYLSALREESIILRRLLNLEDDSPIELAGPEYGYEPYEEKHIIRTKYECILLSEEDGKNTAKIHSPGFKLTTKCNSSEPDEETEPSKFTP